MFKKTLKSVRPGKTFKIEKSPIRYIVIYKEDLKVFCVIIDSHPEEIGKEIIFQSNMKMIDIKSSKKVLLAEIKKDHCFVVENPNNPKTKLFLKLIDHDDNQSWICEELLPKKRDLHTFPTSIPVIKVG